MRRLLILACAIVFVETTFYTAITPLLPHFEQEFGLSKSAAGILAACYPAGTLIGAIPGGYLAAKAGVRPTVLLGLSLVTISCIAFAFATTIVVLDVARFVQGLGGAFCWAGALAWVIGASPRERRGELIGTTMGAAIVGTLVGPAIGALAAGVGVKPTFSAIALVGVAMGAWALSTPAAEPEGTSSPRELLGALRDGRVAGGFVLVLVPGLVMGTIGVLAPLRLDDLGVGASGIAAAWLGAAVLETAVSPIVGRVSDRRGRLYPCLLGLAAASVMTLLFPLPEEAWQLILLVLIAAPTIGMLWAPSMAMLSDGAEAVGIAQGFAFAMSNLGWSVGQTAGNALSARLADATSDAVPYVILSALAAGTLVALVRIRATSPTLA
jgi:predicted MFS family arabinose efflux permease